ncbi:MAG TPA: nitroreductase family protein [Pseudonocardia sp.]|uniref:nitroreductase family protein n=1 Tax=Pseudonocardia sp. TaxID=60912 RepID=UPI002B4B76BF|nr:nitroreductase family protein [Pseudonocardia sp.]HLU54382.1 nitroreductase family protein [Pseudonocardia sp.]
MTVLDLSAEELLTTTRAVRHRLDLDRPVDPALLRRCVEIALQAPSGRNEQGWNFVIVTEPERRAALAELWRRGLGQGDSSMSEAALRRAYRTPGSMEKVWSGLRHLGANLHRAPALVVPCIEGRTDGLGADRQASRWASLLPAVWSFMLAARLHGLGTVWTTGNMAVEREVAELLGIPYDSVMQAAVIPVAHTIGTEFTPAPRVPVDEVLHWNKW